MRMLEDAEWREWSDREIARRCRVHNMTVAAARKKLNIHTDELFSMDRTFIHHKTGEPTKMDITGLKANGDGRPRGCAPI